MILREECCRVKTSALATAFVACSIPSPGSAWRAAVRHPLQAGNADELFRIEVPEIGEEVIEIKAALATRDLVRKLR